MIIRSALASGGLRRCSSSLSSACAAVAETLTTLEALSNAPKFQNPERSLCEPLEPSGALLLLLLFLSELRVRFDNPGPMLKPRTSFEIIPIAKLSIIILENGTQAVMIARLA